jgi:3-oxoacyl-[acyl-carrier protein] reductase
MLQSLEGRTDLSFFVHHRSESQSLNKLQESLGPALVLYQADLTDEASVDELSSRIQVTCEIIVLFAQFAAPPLQIQRFKECSNEALKQSFAVQTLAAATILRSIIPTMKKPIGVARAQAIFVSSEVVRDRPPKGMLDYVVGKYAMLGLMRALAAEFEGPTLRFHAIAPGMMETKFLKFVPEFAIESARSLQPCGFETVNSVAQKLVRLIQNPDALNEDPIYLR